LRQGRRLQHWLCDFFEGQKGGANDVFAMCMVVVVVVMVMVMVVVVMILDIVNTN